MINSFRPAMRRDSPEVLDRGSSAFEAKENRLHPEQVVKDVGRNWSRGQVRGKVLRARNFRQKQNLCCRSSSIWVADEASTICTRLAPERIVKFSLPSRLAIMSNPTGSCSRIALRSASVKKLHTRQ